MTHKKDRNANEKNGMWKGDDVGYNAIHAWIRRRLPQPPNCERCNKEIEKLDLANISQQYLMFYHHMFFHILYNQKVYKMYDLFDYIMNVYHHQ